VAVCQCSDVALVFSSVVERPSLPGCLRKVRLEIRPDDDPDRAETIRIVADLLDHGCSEEIGDLPCFDRSADIVNDEGCRILEAIRVLPVAIADIEAGLAERIRDLPR